MLLTAPKMPSSKVQHQNQPQEGPYSQIQIREIIQELTKTSQSALSTINNIQHTNHHIQNIQSSQNSYTITLTCTFAQGREVIAVYNPGFISCLGITYSWRTSS